MGDWARGRDKRLGDFIEDQSTGFRACYHDQHPIHDGRLRYIVSKNGCSIGFAVPAAQATDTTGGYRHRPVDGKDATSVVIDTIGGIFHSDTCTETELFPKLATATHFKDQQQDDFLAALANAVPRIPALSSYAFRWNGGFGYRAEFTESAARGIEAGAFLEGAKQLR